MTSKFINASGRWVVGSCVYVNNDGDGAWGSITFSFRRMNGWIAHTDIGRSMLHTKRRESMMLVAEWRWETQKTLINCTIRRIKCITFPIHILWEKIHREKLNPSVESIDNYRVSKHNSERKRNSKRCSVLCLFVRTYLRYRWVWPLMGGCGAVSRR